MKSPLVWLFAALFSALQAQTVSTEPLGFVKVDVAAGGPISRTLSVLSFPLQDTASITGRVRGRITSLTANSISDSNAGWTAGALSGADWPHLIKITSGSAAGCTFLISTASANTATTVFIDPGDAGAVELVNLGIKSGGQGDSYSLIRADTLSSLFGTPATTGVMGGATPAGADIVQLWVAGAWRQYYFSTSGSGGWRRVGPDTVSNNVVIRPDAGVIYSRLGPAPLSFLVAGSVPAVGRKTPVARSGVTFLSNGWPINRTLAALNLPSIPGWVSSNSPLDASIVQLLVSGAWRQYYFNGINWRRVGPNTISDNVTIPAGSALLIQRRGTATGFDLLSQALPYAF